MNHQIQVLYVEDEPRSRKVMRMIASTMELSNVVIFEDSADFVPRVQALPSKPDAVLLDIHVKPYSGFEMLKMLRQIDHFSGVPIVAVTASVMNEEIAQLRSAGFDGCLAKPLDMDTFPDTLDRIVRGEMVWHIIG
jgi:CheY-like chemotaxis protein